MATKPNIVKVTKNRSLSVALMALAALGMAGAAAAAAYYLGSNRSDTAVVRPEEPIFLALEPLTVNLQGSGRSRFLHVGITLKLADAQSQGQITQYLPEVRSRALTALSNRDPESLIAAEDKAKLADDILAALSPPLTPTLPAQKISSVMFTTFMVQ
jgi:flagellar FliL protein